MDTNEKPYMSPKPSNPIGITFTSAVEIIEAVRRAVIVVKYGRR